MLFENYIRELLLEAPQVKVGELMKHPGKILLGKDYKSYWDFANDEFKTFYPNEDLSKRGPFFNCIKLCFDEFLSNENDPEFDVAENIREMIIYINALYDFRSNETVAPVYNKFIADGYNGFEELKQAYSKIYEHVGPKNLNMFSNPTHISLIKSSQTQYLFDTPDHTLNGLLCVIPLTTMSSIFWARTNAQAQQVILTKLDRSKYYYPKDPDFLSWCTSFPDESNMFNSYFMRGGTTLFYFLPENDPQGLDKFCIGVTKVADENDKRKKNYSLICGGHTTVDFENKAFISERSNFESDQIQKIILDKFGSRGLTKEMLDIIIEKVSGRNPFDKYAYIGGLKPAEFAATVNMNTIGQTPGGKQQIKQQIETILSVYQEPDFLKQYAPNPKIIAIINKDIRYFTECDVSLKYLDSVKKNDINFWDTYIDYKMAPDSPVNLVKRCNSAGEIANTLKSSGSFNLNLYVHIIKRMMDSVLKTGLENRVNEEFLADFFASIPLSAKLNTNVNELKSLLDFQIDIFKRFGKNRGLSMSIDRFLINYDEADEIGISNFKSMCQEFLRKLFQNCSEFLDLMHLVSGWNYELSLGTSALIRTNEKSFSIPSEWMEEESFLNYFKSFFEYGRFSKSRLIDGLFFTLKTTYSSNYSKFCNENPEFSNNLLILFFEDIYSDSVSSNYSIMNNPKSFDLSKATSHNYYFKQMLDAYFGFKEYLQDNERFVEFGNQLEEFLEEAGVEYNKSIENNISKLNDILGKSKPKGKGKAKNIINQEEVQTILQSINFFVFSGSDGKRQYTQIEKLYEILGKYQNPILYELIQNMIFNPYNRQLSTVVWVMLFNDIFINTINSIFKWVDGNRLYGAVDIYEDRQFQLNNITSFNKILDYDLNAEDLYQAIISDMFKFYGYGRYQVVANVLHRIFPDYDSIPFNAIYSVEDLLRSVDSNPWLGEIDENTRRKYVLGNKILTERQFRKLINHLL